MDLTLNLTHACNMGCTYCFAGRKFGRAMDFATGKQGILLALEQVRDGRLSVAFFGGEPLLEADLLLRLACNTTGDSCAADKPCLNNTSPVLVHCVPVRVQARECTRTAALRKPCLRVCSLAEHCRRAFPDGEPGQHQRQ